MDRATLVTLLLGNAAAIHFAGVVVNLTAPWVYSYRKNLPADDAMRQIFVGQAVWVTLLLGAMGTVCVLYPAQLCAPSGLGHLLAIFLAAIWSSRFVLQLSFYKALTRAQHPVRYFIFLAAFAFQFVVFGAAAMGLLS